MNLNKMKLILSLATVAIAIAGMLSCDSDKDAGPDEQAKFVEKLAGTWTLTGGSVMRDGVDVTGSFSGMTITFSADKRYTVTNAVSPIWPASGTFSLSENNGSFNISRDDGTLITVSQLQTNSVTLSFSYVAPNGRAKSINGEFVFNLKR